MQLQQIRRLTLAAALAAVGLFGQAPPVPSQTTQVLAILTLKPGISRDQLMKAMPDEVRSTVRLYLDGRIQQWFSRGDGKGVVFLLDCKTVDEAKAVLETLPLSKESLATFDYIALGPLTPLRMLL